MGSSSASPPSLIGINSPQIMFEEPRWKQTSYRLTCRYKDTVLPLSNPAHQPGSLLHVRGAMTAKRFVATQRRLEGGSFLDAFGEHHRVFKSEASTLSQVGSARVRRITKQRNEPITPAS